MNLKEISKKVNMNDEELSKFQEKSQKKLKIFNENVKQKDGKNKLNVQKISNKKYYEVKGSFKESIFINLTNDKDIFVYLEYIGNEKDNITAEKFKSHFQKLLEDIYGNQVKSYSESKPSVDVEIYNKKWLSFLPIKTNQDKYELPYVIKNTKEDPTQNIWKPQDPPKTASLFTNKIIKQKNANWSRRGGKRAKWVVKIIKRILKPSFQNFSTLSLEHFVLDEIIKLNENPTNNNLIDKFIDIFKQLKNGELEVYTDDNFEELNLFKKDGEGLIQVKNKSNNVYNKIKNCKDWTCIYEGIKEYLD